MIGNKLFTGLPIEIMSYLFEKIKQDHSGLLRGFFWKTSKTNKEMYNIWFFVDPGFLNPARLSGKKYNCCGKCPPPLESFIKHRSDNVEVLICRFTFYIFFYIRFDGAIGVMFCMLVFVYLIFPILPCDISKEVLVLFSYLLFAIRRHFHLYTNVVWSYMDYTI